MNNRNLINLKRSKNNVANQNSKKRLKEVLSDQFGYRLVKNAFNKKVYRRSYYFYKVFKMLKNIVLPISIGLIILMSGGLLGVALGMPEALVFLTKINGPAFLFMLFFWVVCFSWGVCKGIWSDSCNQLLSILKHDEKICWDKLTKEEQRILHKYIAEKSIKMQKKKLKNMRYGDLLTTKNNMEYLQSIECLSFMPEIYAMNFNINSFESYSLSVMEDGRNNKA